MYDHNTNTIAQDARGPVCQICEGKGRFPWNTPGGHLVQRPCDDCGGTGYGPEHAELCLRCEGLGEYEYPNFVDSGSPEMLWEPCELCDGRGWFA